MTKWHPLWPPCNHPLSSQVDSVQYMHLWPMGNKIVLACNREHESYEVQHGEMNQIQEYYDYVM
jgi:hypothetical protein